ncbi:MAG: ATP-binding cassette domain-containing protein [Flavobacteriales bacterium]|nr:ATP-binding cassette domain-containing protein [Flavobacteriales bacterium]
MKVEFDSVKPTYLSAADIEFSEVYLQPGLQFQEGKKYLIKAHSGRGKSSFLNLLYGKTRNFDGNIKYRGFEHKELFSLRKSVISYVFQDLKLFGELTAIQNVQLKNNLTNCQSNEQIVEWFSMLNLEDKIHQKAKTLSMGQQQRVAIIRAMCQPFQLLLLDEPFSHLDGDNIALCVEIINQQVEKNSATLILTSLSDDSLFDYDFKLKL